MSARTPQKALSFFTLVLATLSLLASALVMCCVTPQGPPQVSVAETVVTPTDTPLPLRIVAGPERQVALITFFGPISTGAGQALEETLTAARQRAEVAVIQIDSPGGLLHESRALARAIEMSPVPVICVVDGLAASGAYYLLQSCPVRLMTTRSALMVHEAYRGGPPTIPELEDEKEKVALRAVNEAMVVQQCGRLSITAAECVERYRGREWWMLPDDAVQMGAVEAIVPTPGDVVLRLGALTNEG